ncbi:MAG: hypothetical protein L3J03_05540 [Desulfobacterales bacterium]|nr:hypothetical protein [Desulfobacterales bacterium]
MTISQKTEQDQPFESKLLATLRQGVDMVKMIFFKQLQEHLAAGNQERPPAFISRLSGAVVNELFGTPRRDEPFASFAREHQQQIKEELKAVADNFASLRIPLTDALRMQCLCDHQQGVDSTEVLKKAARFGVLLKERHLPLPNSFLDLVRRLGVSYNLLHPREEKPAS